MSLDATDPLAGVSPQTKQEANSHRTRGSRELQQRWEDNKVTIVEREPQTETLTEAERRARILEAAALEVEVRGWAPLSACDADGRVCIGGGILFALGMDPTGHTAIGTVPGGWKAFDATFGPDSIEAAAFNDRAARSVGEVTFLLRWRAEEIRDGR